MLKKLIILLLTLGVILTLTGCQEGIINSELEITDISGAGTRSFDVYIYKDGATNLEGDEITLNGAHLPGGTTSVVEKLIEACPLDDAVIEITESTDDYDVVTFSFEFDSIEDYNTKLQLLLEGYDEDEEFQPASLIVNGSNVTFIESNVNTVYAVLWAMDAVYNDPEVYDPSAGGFWPALYEDEEAVVPIFMFVTFNEFRIRIGESELLYDYWLIDEEEEDVIEDLVLDGILGEQVDPTPTPTPTPTPEPSDDLTPTPTPTPKPSDNPTPTPEPSDEPTPTPEPSEEPTDEPTPKPTEEPSDDPTPKSPKTGDNGVLLFTILMAVTGLVFITGKKVSLNRK